MANKALRWQQNGKVMGNMADEVEIKCGRMGRPVARGNKVHRVTF